MENYALIGDLHSQIAPLLDCKRYCQENGLTPVFLGDIFDSRCKESDSLSVYVTLREMQQQFPGMQILRSNHQDKLERYLKGNKVTLLPELKRTLDDLAMTGVSGPRLLEWLESFPYGFCFRDSQGLEYRCAHAFFPSWLEVPRYDRSVAIYDTVKKAKQLMMYGPSHTDGKGRVFWWTKQAERDWVRVAGHYHVVHTDDKSLVLDAGCGGTKRSWFCNEPASLCLWDTARRELVEFAV